MKHMWRLLILIPALAALGACSSLLPKSRTETSTFESFEQARVAIESLQPMLSKREELDKNGFKPGQHPNTNILTHADVVRRYVPSALLKREDLDPGVLACLEARDACRGLEMNVVKLKKERLGNFFADFFNFNRHTETTGFRFNAVVLMVNDLVVFRSWGGQPAVKEVEQSRNPLGPFQEIGPPVANSAATGK
jgi:hypothetical protein